MAQRRRTRPQSGSKVSGTVHAYTHLRDEARPAKGWVPDQELLRELLECGHMTVRVTKGCSKLQREVTSDVLSQSPDFAKLTAS